MSDLFKTLRRECRRYSGLALVAMLGGCSGGGYEDPALPAPPPLGTDALAVQQVQLNGALADKLTVYEHEWANDGATLGDYGSRHLEEILDRVETTDHPITVEKVTDAQMNEARREYLVAYLIEHRISDADRRVVVQRPKAYGEPADDSIELYQIRPTAGTSASGGR